MSKRSKQYRKVAEKKITDVLSLTEAIKKVKEGSYSSFNGTVEMHLALKLPKDTDSKSIKGSLSLPHSLGGKSSIVAVFTTPDKDDVAKKAGADFVGMEQLIKDVQKGKVSFDVAIATPDVMPKIAILGKQLGPKGIMPNPKTGTVTEDLETVIKEYKSGKQTFKCEDAGLVHLGVGKIDMDDEKVLENINVAITAVAEAVGKPAHQIIKHGHLAPTMGTSVKFKYEASEE